MYSIQLSLKFIIRRNDTLKGDGNYLQYTQYNYHEKNKKK